jgi:hypothetical protein
MNAQRFPYCLFITPYLVFSIIIGFLLLAVSSTILYIKSSRPSQYIVYIKHPSIIAIIRVVISSWFVKSFIAI